MEIIDFKDLSSTFPAATRLGVLAPVYGSLCRVTPTNFGAPVTKVMRFPEKGIGELLSSKGLQLSPSAVSESGVGTAKSGAPQDTALQETAWLLLGVAYASD